MAGRLAREIYLRNFVFGVEDSLVSTVGLLSGIAVGGVPRPTIVLTGVVLIFVEAISMAAGSFLSEASAEEIGHVKDPITRSVRGGSVMFVSYFLAGFLPLAPYAISGVTDPFRASIAVSLLALFLLGFTSGRISHRDVLRRGLRMFVVGGLAIAVGVAVGAWLG